MHPPFSKPYFSITSTEFAAKFILASLEEDLSLQDTLRKLVGMGHKVGKTKVERTMKKHGIRAKTKRKFRVTTDSKHKHPFRPRRISNSPRDSSPPSF
jgi:hypothetical protein